MQTLNVVFIGLMAMIATIDFKTLKVPAWSLCVLCILIALKGNFSPLDAIYGLALMMGSMFLSDFILKKETIGGGDLWLGTAMSAFMGFDRFLIAYTVAALLGMIAMATIYRNQRSLDIAYVPYLAYGAFWAMFIAR